MAKTSKAFKEGDRLSGSVVTIYAAVTNTDTTEGRGSEIDHSYYLTEPGATMGASGIGVMGGDGTVEPRTALRLTDGRHILLSAPVAITDANTAELRKKALSKLTKAERAALRLSEQ